VGGAEAGTATRINSTPFPFSDDFYTCGYGSVSATGRDGRSAVWQVHTARVSGSTVMGCNMVTIYRNWAKKGSIELPSGELVASSPVPNSGTTTMDTGFVVQLKSGAFSTINLADYDK